MVQRRWCFRSTFSCVYFVHSLFRSHSGLFCFHYFFFFFALLFVIFSSLSFVDVRDVYVVQEHFKLSKLFVSFRVLLFRFFLFVFFLWFLYIIFLFLWRRSLSLDFCSEFFSTYQGWSVLQVCIDAGRSASVSNRRSHGEQAGTLIK